MDDDTVIDLITDFLRSRNLVHTAECLEQERDVLLHQIPHANGNTVNYKSSILEQLLVEGRRSLFVDRDGVQVSAEVERSKQLYYESKAKSPKIMTNNHHHGNEKEVDWNFLKKSSAATVVDEDRAYFDDEESDEIILRPQLNVTESSPSLQKEEIEDSNAESQNSKLSRNEQFWRSNSVSSARSSKSMSFVESGSDREVDVDVGVATPNDLPSEDEARDADEWVDEEDPGYFKIPFGEYYEDVESDEDFEFNSNYYPAEPKQEQQESPFNQFLSNTQGEATSTPISAASSRNSLQSFKSPIIDSKSSIQQISNESPSTKDLYVEGGKLIYEGDGKRSIFQLEIVEEPDDGLSEDNNDNDNDGNEDEDPYSVTESHEWDSSAFSEVSSQGVQSLTSSSQNFLNTISSPYKTDDNSKLSPLLNHIQQQNNAQGVTNKSNGITQQNNINDSFTNEDFEVERLNEILRDHIQLRRDEFYQENYNPSVASNNNINNNNVIGNTGNAAQGSDIQRLWDSKEQENELFPKTETLPSLENFFPAKEVTTNKFQELTPESTPTHTKNQHSLDNLDFHEESKPQEIQYESFNLPIIYQKGRTGLEETKDFPIIMNSVIASRYQILDFLGSAAFSTAVKCLDLITGQQVCVKIIKNNKEFLDQSLDEIKLLMFINSNIDPDEKHVLQLYDYFYHREHLFIVSELLRENLYEFYKFNRESGDAIYFTIDRIKLISKQLLIALQFIHNLSLIHADLKPENILIKSYSRCEVKMIDFGSSCFTRDHLSSYVQSRSYRAPEVILGLPYDQRIDIWSLGCILAELWSGRVLFQNESIATLLARVVSILGPFEIEMLQCARHANKYFTKSNTLYDRTESGQVFILKPKRTSLKSRLKCDDDLFIDFVSYLLTLRPDRRPTATEALQHPFLSEN